MTPYTGVDRGSGSKCRINDVFGITKIRATCPEQQQTSLYEVMGRTALFGRNVVCSGSLSGGVVTMSGCSVSRMCLSGA